MLVTEPGQILLVTYLNYGDPERSARPHPLICPDLVSELDILDCNVVPGEAIFIDENKNISPLPERKTRQCFPLQDLVVQE